MLASKIEWWRITEEFKPEIERKSRTKSYQSVYFARSLSVSGSVIIGSKLERSRAIAHAVRLIGRKVHFNQFSAICRAYGEASGGAVQVDLHSALVSTGSAEL